MFFHTIFLLLCLMITIPNSSNGMLPVLIGRRSSVRRLCIGGCPQLQRNSATPRLNVAPFQQARVSRISPVPPSSREVKCIDIASIELKSLQMDHFTLNLADNSIIHSQKIDCVLQALSQDKQMKKHLVELDISDNALTGEIDWTLLAKFKQLETIIARNNSIQSGSDNIPWDILTNLRQFDFSYNPALSINIELDHLPTKLTTLHVQHTNAIALIDWKKI
eukprot:1146341_1